MLAGGSMDKIRIEGLKLSAFVGVSPEEKLQRIPIVLDICVFCELRKAGLSDNLDDTVDYAWLVKEIANFVGTGTFNLIESIAEGVAAKCLQHGMVESVNVRVEKPGIISDADRVSVEIERKKGA